MPHLVRRLSVATSITAFVGIVGCSKYEILDAIVPRGGERTLNVAYGDQPRQRLDVYRSRPTTRRAPVVVFFYGGDWRSGSKAGYRFVAQALTSHGYLAIIPDYRLYPDVTFPGFVEDGALAVRWARDHAQQFGGDPDKLFLMGHSAGAHIAAMLTLDRHYLDDAGVTREAILGTVGLSGPYNFVLRDQDAPVFRLASATKPAPQMQPITFTDGTAPPMLLIHGAKDTIVDPKNTPELAAAIRAQGGHVQTISYSKRGHPDIALSLAWGFRWLAPTLDDTLTFFRGVLATDGARICTDDEEKR